MVHLQIDVLYLFKYLFNISEYKAMLIKLLIYHINIDVCICVYIRGGTVHKTHSSVRITVLGSRFSVL